MELYDEKIDEKKSKIKKDTSLNDLDILNDTLLSFKFLVDNFAVALNEASNKFIYDKFKLQFDELSKTQQTLFQLAFQKGWYTLEEADKSKINEAIKQNTKKQTELSVN